MPLRCDLRRPPLSGISVALARVNAASVHSACADCARGEVHTTGDLDMLDKRNGNGSGVALEPIRGTRGAVVLGPRNIPLENENPSLLLSPETDAGTVPNLKFSFAAARNRIAAGGWAREVTVRELPISTKMASVNMRLQPGGIRELHWHK